MEQNYWFVAQTYVDLAAAYVSYFAIRPGSYGLHTTPDVNDEYICYFSTEEKAKHFAYDGIANTDRTVHARCLPSAPKNLR